MKRVAESSTRIVAPISDVYEYATNLELFGDWFPDVEQVVPLNNLLPTHRGKQYLETVRLPFGQRRKIKISVVDSKPDELLVTEGSFFPLMSRMEFRFGELQDGSTKVTWQMFSRNDSAIFSRFFLPLVRQMMQKRGELGLLALRWTLDRSNSTGSQPA